MSEQAATPAAAMPESAAPEAEMREEDSEPEAIEDDEPEEVGRDPHCCPECGSTHYRRSRRTLLERLLMRPKMARCKSCHFRFPYPET